MMDFETLKEIIKDAGGRLIQRSHGGKICIAVGTELSALLFMADLADDLATDARAADIAWLLRNVKQEQFGREIILYWPEIEWKE